MANLNQNQSNYNHIQKINTYYKELVENNYTEEPVDILTFISNPQYLGIPTRNGRDVYPRWKKALAEMFDDNGKILIVLTGSIGTGKSTIALMALCYIQYRLMILKNPWGIFDLQDSGKMTISFFNLNKTLGESRGFTKMMALMSKSPWFRNHALSITPTKSGEVLEFGLIKYALASPYSHGFGVVGEDVVAGVLDEVDSPIESLKQKVRVLEAYNATVIRFKNRFAQTGYSLGKLFIVSSKQDEMSFIDTFVAERKNSSEVLIFDVPLWEAKPEHTFCGKTFPVAIGDAYNPPKIIEESDIAKYVQDGYQIIRPPIEFKIEFQLDLTRALRDIAGVTVAGTRKSKLFPSEKFIIDCIDRVKEDPILGEKIDIGLNDSIDLIQFINLSKFRMPKSTPRFIHLDISFTNDASGISMAGVKDWTYKDVQNQDGTYRKEIVPIVETDFSMRIKARPGDRIPIHKIRKLVFDLRAAGFLIYKFTADLLLASEDTLQLFKASGIEAEYFSLDKSNGPYFDFRNLVYEKRWVCHPNHMLQFELKNLEQSATDGKVDHPLKVVDVEFLPDGGIKETVMEGSKDLADATVGAVTQCLYNCGQPINTQIISNLLQKSAGSLPPEENVSRILGMTDATGQEIVGHKVKDQINAINDIFKKIKGR